MKYMLRFHLISVKRTIANPKIGSKMNVNEVLWP